MITVVNRPTCSPVMTPVVVYCGEYLLPVGLLLLSLSLQMPPSLNLFISPVYLY